MITLGPFARGSSRPSFTTVGRSFLIKPRFYIDQKLVFQWQMRCIDTMPELSIEVIKITCNRKDVTDYFELADILSFPVTEAPRKGSVVCVTIEYELPLDWDSVTVGCHCLHIEMKLLGKSHHIMQNFVLIKKEMGGT